VKKEALNQLIREWYQIAKDSGFEDAEEITKTGDIKLKRYDSLRFKKRDDGRKVRAVLHDREYLDLVQEYVNDPNTEYRNNAERVIMMKHADQWLIKDIVVYLRRMRLYRHRHTVRLVIRRYLHRWGIRNFTLAQLKRLTQRTRF